MKQLVTVPVEVLPRDEADIHDVLRSAQARFRKGHCGRFLASQMQSHECKMHRTLEKLKERLPVVVVEHQREANLEDVTDALGAFVRSVWTLPKRSIH